MPELDKIVEHIVSLDSGYKRRRLAIILGSGWGPVVDALMTTEGEVAYEDIPGFPVSTVEGHAGRLLWGDLAGVPVYCMQGRFHHYEGYSMEEVTLPVRVFNRIGVGGLVLTNAAGGIRKDFRAGDLMLVEDHINFMGVNPLRGPNIDEDGTRFPDMTAAWDASLQDCLEQAARETAVQLHKGIYIAVSGPSFETPAEIRAFAKLGADAVGMSTVPECIVGRHCGMRVAGISCITNLAAHVGGETLTHEEVARAARKSLADVIALFHKAMPLMYQSLTE